MNLTAFILAAGLGERLRPITNHIPKPLLPVLGKPVLECVLEKVSALSTKSIGINLHYKKEDIEQWIMQSVFRDRVTLFPEDPVLGTGGALKNAEGFLGKGPFLVHNADILSDIDLAKLIAVHRQSDNIATLAVHHFPAFNNLVVDGSGCLTEMGAMCSLCRSPGSRLVAFTGIAVYSPAFLQALPGGSSSVVHAWTQVISSGQRIGTYDVAGCSWTDIGTPASYARAVADELRNSGETVYIHPSVESCRYVEMDGYAVIEKGSRLGQGISLRNCIVLPGTKAGIESRTFENCVLGPDFTVRLNESDFLYAAEENTFHIGTGGSDRKYYRIKKNGRSLVLMQCPEGDADFERHIEYSLFFKKYSLPVPELIERDPERKRAFFEDLGDLSLYSWLKCGRGQDELEEMYKKILDILVLLHTSATDHISECRLLEDRIFDYDHLLWETRYFVQHFIEGIRGIKISNAPALNEEFHRLAVQADSFRKTIVHRDFQSQNIMVGKGKIPRLLDYQGARMGPPAYDAASILWDPYYRLEGGLRERLLHYYIMRMEGSAQWFNGQVFRESLLPCRLQRHMQALGAYAFLYSVKKKKYFLKHIPEALRLLREDLSEARNEYPVLDEMVNEI